MNDILRERLWRNLEALPEDRLYQVLDYIEFMTSKYARDGATPPATPLRHFAERLEDHLRLQGVGLGAIRGTMELVGTADRVANEVAGVGRALLRELETGIIGTPAGPAIPPGESPPADGLAEGRGVDRDPR